MFSNDKDEVDDLFQEVLINMWRGFDSFESRSSVNTWIYRVAMNTCISAERKKQSRPDIVPLSMDINLYEDNDADTNQVKQLHKRISKLGLVDRAIILMWLEDMSYDEIAAIVGITPQFLFGRFSRRLHRRLRHRSQDVFPHPEISERHH